VKAISAPTFKPPLGEFIIISKMFPGTVETFSETGNIVLKVPTVTTDGVAMCRTATLTKNTKTRRTRNLVRVSSFQLLHSESIEEPSPRQATRLSFKAATDCPYSRLI
jgi:hypothetical protein